MDDTAQKYGSWVRRKMSTREVLEVMLDQLPKQMLNDQVVSIKVIYKSPCYEDILKDYEFTAWIVETKKEIDKPEEIA